MAGAKGFSEKVFAVVARIPKGKVASYGLVGELAGFPRSARQVGMVMRLGTGLPWWRVLAKDGRVVIGNPAFRFEQIQRLQLEGVEVSPAGYVDYDRYAWRPIGARTSRSRRPAAEAPSGTAARRRPPATKRGRAEGR